MYSILTLFELCVWYNCVLGKSVLLTFEEQMYSLALKRMPGRYIVGSIEENKDISHEIILQLIPSSVCRTGTEFKRSAPLWKALKPSRLLCGEVDCNIQV